MALTKIPANLLDTTGHVDLLDNEKLRLGTSQDMLIFHDGNHSLIDDAGDGSLILRSDTSVILRKRTGDENMVVATPDGAVELYHDNSKKFETSAAGATVTGALTVTGDLNITGDVNSASVTDLDVVDKTITLGKGQVESASGGSGIVIDGSGASFTWDETNDRWLSNKKIALLEDVIVNANAGQDVNVEVGAGTSQNHYSYIDLIGDATYSDYGLRLIRNNGGANTSSGIHHRGTGNLFIRTDDAGAIRFETNATERARISSGGRFLLGHSSAITTASGQIPFSQITGTNASTSGFSISRFSADTFGPTQFFVKSRNGTPGSNTIVQSGDTIGTIDFKMDDGTNYQTQVARIMAKIDGTPGENDAPGRLTFHTTADGAATVSERMRITNAGHVGIGMTPAPVGSDTCLSIYNTVSPRIKLHNSTSGTASGDGAELNTYNSDFIIENREAGNVRFFNNGSERMRIDTNGQAMIGHTSSFAHADADNLAIGDGTNNSGLTIYTGSSKESSIIFGNTGTNGNLEAGIKYYHESHGTVANRRAMTFATGGSMQERMRINSSGNVGIGNTNPQAKLNTNLQVEGSILAYMSGTSLTFDGGSNVAVSHSSSALGTGTAGGLLLANNNNSNGAPSPLIAFSARSASSSYNHTYATIHGEKSSSGADSNWNTGALIFSTGSSTGPNERMRIESDGDLKIFGTFGTNSSTAFGSMSGRLTFDTDYSDTQRGPNKVVLQEDGAWIAGLGISNGSTDFYSGGHITFRTGTSLGTERMRITSAGHVAIVSGKRFYFNVNSISNGDTYIDEYSTNEVGITTGGSRKLAVSGGNLYVSGSVNANHNFSDERLKENVVVIPNALQKVSSLRGITFTRKDDGSVGTGLIAQELEAVLPEAVYEAKMVEELENPDAEAWKSINYGNTVGLLVEAIKELKTELDAAKARIETLEG